MKTLRIPKHTKQLLLLLCGAVVVYIPTISFGFFVWDDHLLAQAPWYDQNMVAIIQQAFTSFQHNLYHPITTLSFAFDYFLSGNTPSLFHATNLIIHVVNAFVVFILIKKLTSQTQIAFISALLFTIHPLQTEAVVWISSRKDLLCTLFYTLGLLSYLNVRYEQKRMIWVYVFFILALFSKPQAITFPLAIILIDISFLPQQHTFKKLILHKVPLLFLSLCIGVLGVWHFSQITLIKPHDEYLFSSGNTVLASGYCLFLYLKKLAIPTGQSIFYPFIQLTWIHYALSLATLLGGILLTRFLYRKDRMAFFGWCFFVVNIALTLPWFQLNESIISERYLYLSSLGICIIIGRSVAYIMEHASSQNILRVGGVLLILVLVSLSSLRVMTWKTNESIMTDAYMTYPTSHILNNSLASIHIEHQEYDLAETKLNVALATAPKYVDALKNRGVVYFNQKKIKKAISDYSRVLALNPTDKQVLFNRGSLYKDLGQYKNAINDYSEYLIYKNNNALVFHRRGVCFDMLNETDNALRDYSHAIALDTTNEYAYFNRANIYGKMGYVAQGLNDIEQALSINPSMKEALYLRGILTFQSQGNGCADLLEAQRLGYTRANKAIQTYCY